MGGGRPTSRAIAPCLDHFVPQHGTLGIDRQTIKVRSHALVFGDGYVVDGDNVDGCDGVGGNDGDDVDGCDGVGDIDGDDVDVCDGVGDNDGDRVDDATHHDDGDKNDADMVMVLWAGMARGFSTQVNRSKINKRPTACYTSAPYPNPNPKSNPKHDHCTTHTPTPTPTLTRPHPHHYRQLVLSVLRVAPSPPPPVLMFAHLSRLELTLSPRAQSGNRPPCFAFALSQAPANGAGGGGGGASAGGVQARQWWNGHRVVRGRLDFRTGHQYQGLCANHRFSPAIWSLLVLRLLGRVGAAVTLQETFDCT